MCEHLCMHGCVFSLHVYVLVCACACLGEQAESHLQSTGSLIDWIKPLDRTQTEWKLNKITVIYSSGNGSLSGESGAADLCPATQIWAEMPSILRTAFPPGSSWCITAAPDQSIYLLSALPASLHLLPARTVIPQRTGPGAMEFESVLPMHSCPPPPALRVSHWLNRHPSCTYIVGV